MQKKKIKITVILIVILAVLAILAFGTIYLLNNYIIPNMRYKDAKKAIEEKNYTEAYNILSDINNHEKAEKLLEKFEYKLLSIKDSDGNPYELYEYDADGNCIVLKKFVYESGATKEEKHTYEYDDEGNKIKDIYMVLLNGKETSKNTTKFEYDPYGNCILEKDSVGKTEYAYNENGDIISETFTGLKYNTITIYRYENGLLKSKCSYTDDIYLDDYLVEYFYNDAELLIKKQEAYYDYYGSGTLSNTFKYNDEGLLIEEDDDSAVYTYKYNKEGNCTEEICQQKNTSESVITKFNYDESGRITTKKIINNNNTVNLSYEYKIFYNPEKDLNDVDDKPDSTTDNNKPFSETEILEIYSPKIEEYRSAYKLSYDKFLMQYPNDQSINASALNKIRNSGSLSYALYDIDKNGVEELLIGIGDTIIDLYSVSKGEMLKLFRDCSFCKPNNIHILSNGILLYEGIDSTYSGSFIKHYITKDKNGKTIVASAGSKYYNDRAKKGKIYKNMLSKEDYTKICNIMLKTSVKDELDWKKIIK